MLSFVGRHRDMTSIAEIQQRKEQKIDQKYDSNQRQSDAARTLQRTYRGHRARRELKGLTLTPSARWAEVRTPCSIMLFIRDANRRLGTYCRQSKKQSIKILLLRDHPADHKHPIRPTNPNSIASRPMHSSNGTVLARSHAALAATNTHPVMIQRFRPRTRRLVGERGRLRGKNA